MIWNLLIVAYVIGTIVIGHRPGVQHEATVVVITIELCLWVIGNGALICIGYIVRRVNQRTKSDATTEAAVH